MVSPGYKIRASDIQQTGNKCRASILPFVKAHSTSYTFYPVWKSQCYEFYPVCLHQRKFCIYRCSHLYIQLFDFQLPNGMLVLQFDKQHLLPQQQVFFHTSVGCCTCPPPPTPAPVVAAAVAIPILLLFLLSFLLPINTVLLVVEVCGEGKGLAPPRAVVMLPMPLLPPVDWA